MKVLIIGAPSENEKVGIRLTAESDEDRTILWCLHQLGPTMYKVVEMDEAGEAQATALILEDSSAAS